MHRIVQVYFVQGTALEQRDLVRAGVLGVDKAIILAGNISAPSPTHARVCIS